MGNRRPQGRARDAVALACLHGTFNYTSAAPGIRHSAGAACCPVTDPARLVRVPASRYAAVNANADVVALVATLRGIMLPNARHTT
jgi:hypothetical protein